METIYYGHVDKVEGDNNDVHFEFHCIESPLWKSIRQLLDDQFRAAILENKDQVIVLSTKKTSLREIYDRDDFLDLESRWVRLDTNDENRGLPNSGDIVQIQLNNKISLDDFPNASEEDILALVNRSNHPLPIAIGHSSVSYSLGAKNTYGHPKATAQTAHNRAGWLTAHCKETDGGK